MTANAFVEALAEIATTGKAPTLFARGVIDACEVDNEGVLQGVSLWVGEAKINRCAWLRGFANAAEASWVVSGTEVLVSFVDQQPVIIDIYLTGAA
jgi:hypothetical protein